MATTESASALVVKKVQHRNVCDVLDLHVVDTFVLLIFVPSNLPVDVARSVMFSCCPFVCLCVCVCAQAVAFSRLTCLCVIFVMLLIQYN